MTRLLVAVLAGCAAVVGCGKSRSDQGQAVAATQSAAPTESDSPRPGSSSSTAQGLPCPRTGLWATCSVEKRLVQAGFVVNRGDNPGPARAGFTVRPALYTLGKSRLEVFVYPTESAANADVARLDTLVAAPRGSRGAWDVPPTFVRSANLLAVYLTENPTQAERLTLALTAGAPQP